VSTYKVGDRVQKGYYLSINKFDLKLIESDNSVLSGKDGANYFLTSKTVLLAFAPLAAGFFILAFPFMFLTALIVAPLTYFLQLPKEIAFGSVDIINRVVASLKHLDISPIKELIDQYLNSRKKR